jgi:aminopeptidase 2
MPAISEDIYTPEGKTSCDAALADLLSSMSIENDGWKITRFQTTPPMSSYIVAFANGPFKYLEKFVTMPLSGKTLPLRIYGMQTLKPPLHRVFIFERVSYGGQYPSGPVCA